MGVQGLGVLSSWRSTFVVVLSIVHCLLLVIYVMGFELTAFEGYMMLFFSPQPQVEGGVLE